MSGSKPLVRVMNLTKHFPIKGGLLFRKKVSAVQAVDDVSFDIRKGETLGLVGESGSGKTTVGRTLLLLYQPTAGQVFYRDMELTSASSSALRQARRNMQIIFQDPYASLNPRMPALQIIREPLDIHRLYSPFERRERVLALMERVGMNPDLAKRYPHEFSGGQRQRIGIARALALQPEFIVCDEPISALDVSIQAQVVNLLQDLQREFSLTYLFIAHDLSMVKHISDRVAVMYLGKIVELGGKRDLYARPLHPYTQALLSAVPLPNPEAEQVRERIVLEGDIPSPSNPPPGCRFHTRCPIAKEICQQEIPAWREIESDHWVACHFV